MKPIQFIAGCALLGFIAGCSGFGLPPAKTPAQAVYEAKAGFLASLAVADAYNALPLCPMSAPICKTAAVLDTVRKSANAASTALDAAQETVTNPAFASGNAVSQAVIAAEGEVKAFATITATLQVKP